MYQFESGVSMGMVVEYLVVINVYYIVTSERQSRIQICERA